ncbi:hypothetical protein TWF225_003026 [Orbilia oligospora]|nr:hypothetical protein TWF225_003026 [Orbilia oligospora]KAF3267988.1 hypothetical protein TWF217_011703 [Orbilia oligospora]KAF3269723.1 hypothetical protein TWF128_005903 [Orbilia oligospora]KAF3294644.1 hypothetical protein TWF132_003126 [Orbilia oligospora]
MSPMAGGCQRAGQARGLPSQGLVSGAAFVLGKSRSSGVEAKRASSKRANALPGHWDVDFSFLLPAKKAKFGDRLGGSSLPAVLGEGVSRWADARLRRVKARCGSREQGAGVNG